VLWRHLQKYRALGRQPTAAPWTLAFVHRARPDSMVTFNSERLRKDGEVEKGISPILVIREWIPRSREWSTKAVLIGFFASPCFPRLLDPESIKDTIAARCPRGRARVRWEICFGEYEPFRLRGGGASLNAQRCRDFWMTCILCERMRRRRITRSLKKSLQYCIAGCVTR